MQMHSPQSTNSGDIVIVGGGAGGLELAVRLAKAGHEDVLLIDRETTHVWKPRLHEVAAGLGRRQVDELGYAGLAEQWGFRYECGTLESIDSQQRQITLAAMTSDTDSTCDEVPTRIKGYRQLVLALGGVTPDMGVEGVLEHACLLDSPADAERIAERYSRGLLAHHTRTADATDEKAMLDPYRVVIVGSGATGVELAAYLAGEGRSAHESRTPDARSRESSDVEITILEATDTFMPGVSQELRDAIHQRLVTEGINIELSRQVAKVSDTCVVTGEGEEAETLAADLVVWAAGRVGPAIVEKMEGLASNKKRQWQVTAGLECLDHDDIFALGDCCCIEGDPVPPTAQVASEQAEFLAEELPRRQKGEPAQDFVFKDSGTLLSLSNAGSVGELSGKWAQDLQVRGRFARAAYHGLQRQHQFLLLGNVKGTTEMISDVFRRSMGPHLKVH